MSDAYRPRPGDDPLSQPARGQGHGGVVAPSEAGTISVHEWRLDQLKKIRMPQPPEEVVAGSGTRWATKVVAADDSSEEGKAVADYVCDGVDDDVEINAAAAAMAGWSGGRLVLLEGSFFLSSPIVLGGYGIILQGSGPGVSGTLLFDDGLTSGDPLIAMDGYTEDILVTDLYGYSDVGPAVIFGTGVWSKVDRCHFSNAGAGVDSIVLGDGAFGGGVGSVTNCVIENGGGSSYAVNDPGGRGRIIGNWFAYGGVVLSGRGTVVAGNTFADNQKDAVLLTGAVAEDNLVTSNVIYCSSPTTNTKDAIVFAAAAGRNFVQGNVVRPRRVGTARLWRYCVAIPSGCNNNLVTNNDFLGAYTTGAINDAGTGTVTTAGNRS